MKKEREKKNKKKGRKRRECGGLLADWGPTPPEKSKAQTQPKNNSTGFRFKPFRVCSLLLLFIFYFYYF